MTKGNHLEPPKKIDRTGTSWSTLKELFLHQELEIQDTRGGAREEEVLPPDWKLPWLWNQVVMEDLHSRASWRGGAHERGRAREGVSERERVHVRERERVSCEGERERE